MKFEDPSDLRQMVNDYLSQLNPEYKSRLKECSLAKESFDKYCEVFELNFCNDCDKFRKHWRSLYLNYVSYTIWNAVVDYEVGVLGRKTRKNSGHNDADKLQKEFLLKFKV